MWTWLLNPRNLFLAALCIGVAVMGTVILIQKGVIAAKSGKIEQQAQQLSAVTRQNEILQNNAAAVALQDKKMKALQEQTEGLQDLVNTLPAEIRKGLKNEKLDRVNDCIVDFFNTGMLPAGCLANSTGMSKTGDAQAETRR